MEGESANTELSQAASQTDTNNNQVWVFVLLVSILKALHHIQHYWQNVMDCYQDLAGGIFVGASGATIDRETQKAGQHLFSTIL